MLDREASVEKLDVVRKMDQNCPINKKIGLLKAVYGGSETERQAYY